MENRFYGFSSLPFSEVREMGASKEKSWGGNYPSPHQPLCWSLNTFCNELMAKAQYKAARKGLWVASPYAAIYLCDNKRIVFLSSPLAPQRAAFEAGTDDSRSHLGSAVGCPCGNWEIPKNVWLMTEIQSPMCPVGKKKHKRAHVVILQMFSLGAMKPDLWTRHFCVSLKQ